MRLFNDAYLLKMRTEDRFELFVYKLGIHLFLKLGAVKLRGNRYVYDGHDVITIDGDEHSIEIKLFNPVVEIDEETEEEAVKVKLIKTLHIAPGHQCADKLRVIHDHVDRVNKFHDKKAGITVR